MDMSQAKAAAGKARSLAKAGLTEQHIFALLAYADRDGVTDKFNRQFGEGAAERIIAGRSNADVLAAHIGRDRHDRR